VAEDVGVRRGRGAAAARGGRGDCGGKDGLQLLPEFWIEIWRLQTLSARLLGVVGTGERRDPVLPRVVAEGGRCCGFGRTEGISSGDFDFARGIFG
jgi:hypothetical protein